MKKRLWSRSINVLLCSGLHFFYIICSVDFIDHCLLLLERHLNLNDYQKIVYFQHSVMQLSHCTHHLKFLFLSNVSIVKQY